MEAIFGLTMHRKHLHLLALSVGIDAGHGAASKKQFNPNLVGREVAPQNSKLPKDVGELILLATKCGGEGGQEEQ